MATFRDSLALISIALSTLPVGCGRSASIQPTPEQAHEEDRCWWAAYRTELAPDSVAVRFARAYERIGLEGVSWSQLGDTAWAYSRTTVLEGPSRIGTYALRVVAFRDADATFFRPFQTIVPDAPPASRMERAEHSREITGFCAEVARLAGVQALAPNAPERDELFPRWRARP